MAKDPRFNFYVDNWIGGTEGFTLEQEGAYLSLIIMQSKVGRFTKIQAMDKLLQKTRGNAAASAGLWNFLLPKLETDGVVFWSERLELEMEKSKIHSQKQSERAKKKYIKNPADTTAQAAAVPVGSGSSIGSNPESGKGVKGERIPDEWFTEKFDEENLQLIKMQFKDHDIQNELAIFKLKVRGSPDEYFHRDAGSIRTAFIYQLTRSNGKKHGANRGTNNTTSAVIDGEKGYKQAKL